MVQNVLKIVLNSKKFNLTIILAIGNYVTKNRVYYRQVDNLSIVYENAMISPSIYLAMICNQNGHWFHLDTKYMVIKTMVKMQTVILTLEILFKLIK